jgi:hypothetical protein
MAPGGRQRGSPRAGDAEGAREGSGTPRWGDLIVQKFIGPGDAPATTRCLLGVGRGCGTPR